MSSMNIIAFKNQFHSHFKDMFLKPKHWIIEIEEFLHSWRYPYWVFRSLSRINQDGFDVKSSCLAIGLSCNNYTLVVLVSFIFCISNSLFCYHYVGDSAYAIVCSIASYCGS